MDRALKERIIGAIVLVVFVVLVVPVFLDGPPTENDVIRERVPLPGQNEQPLKMVILDRDRTEPVPSEVDASQPASAIRTAEPEPEPAQLAKPENAVEPEPEPSTAIASSADIEADEPPPQTAPREAPKIQRSAGSATGMWAVQLGSFSSADNANRLAADLRQKGFAAFLSKTDNGGKELHRVRIGPQKDKPAAEAMASRLKDAGHTGQVVPHP
ncbi:MAG: SPOR domain-containing protein [Woeseiaceae bacterium]|nr:SPOR domain-containing protein [Woeseiaceae bacterium]